MDGIRINKYMSEAGICSRREADRLIEEGRVRINGTEAGVGTRVLPGDRVTVDGQEAVEQKEADKVLLAYNKPKGVECTSDRSNPDNIIDKIGYSRRIYTIGRLDKSSCGLILLTNDGELAYRISKAGDNHEKEYIVRVDRPFPDSFLEELRKGVELPEKKTAPCKTERLSEQMFRITLIQGLNRQIRRMCECFDYKVVYLKRIRVMNILLGDLAPGTYRVLAGDELKELKRRLGLSISRETGKPEEPDKMPGKKSGGKDVHFSGKRGRTENESGRSEGVFSGKRSQNETGTGKISGNFSGRKENGSDTSGHPRTSVRRY